VAVGGIAPFTYYWEGTDGLASAGQNVVKSYTTTGTKTATLSVVDAEGTTYIQACDGTVNVTQ
jgi:PKD repeat protein